MADHSKDHFMLQGIISKRYGMLNLDHFVELHNELIYDIISIKRVSLMGRLESDFKLYLEIKWRLERSVYIIWGIILTRGSTIHDKYRRFQGSSLVLEKTCFSLFLCFIWLVANRTSFYKCAKTALCIVAAKRKKNNKY